MSAAGRGDGFAVDVCVEQLRRAVPGGIGTYCRGLLQGLRDLTGDERPEITLLASRPGGRGAGGPGAPAPAPDPLAELGWPTRTSMLPPRLALFCWEHSLAAGLGATRPGVLHATSFAFPPRGARSLVAVVHDVAWRRHPEAFPLHGRRWHERAVRRVAKEASAIIVPSSRSARDLVDGGLGISPERVHVVEEGADHLPAPDEAAAASLLERLGVGAGYLLSVGTLEPRKNLPRLVAAYEQARRRLDEPWPLVIVGPAGWGDAAVAIDRLPEGVVIAGEVEPATLSALFAAARCVVYVPMVEGFGLPAAEAMVQGAPVVVSAGLPSAGGAGVPVDPLDAESIGDALVRASRDGAERDQAIESGKARAAELRWSRCAAAHVRIWREVAAG